jgi:hypothetical protein
MPMCESLTSISFPGIFMRVIDNSNPEVPLEEPCIEISFHINRIRNIAVEYLIKRKSVIMQETFDAISIFDLSQEDASTCTSVFTEMQDMSLSIEPIYSEEIEGCELFPNEGNEVLLEPEVFAADTLEIDLL